jgi:hypothetical protein
MICRFRLLRGREFHSVFIYVGLTVIIPLISVIERVSFSYLRLLSLAPYLVHFDHRSPHAQIFRGELGRAPGSAAEAAAAAELIVFTRDERLLRALQTTMGAIDAEQVCVFVFCVCVCLFPRAFYFA